MISRRQLLLFKIWSKWLLGMVLDFSVFWLSALLVFFTFYSLPIYIYLAISLLIALNFYFSNYMLGVSNSLRSDAQTYSRGTALFGNHFSPSGSTDFDFYTYVIHLFWDDQRDVAEIVLSFSHVDPLVLSDRLLSYPSLHLSKFPWAYPYFEHDYVFIAMSFKEGRGFFSFDVVERAKSIHPELFV